MNTAIALATCKKSNITLLNIVLLLLASAIIYIFLNEPAAAQAINLSPVQNFLSSITGALTGTLGKTAATLALIATLFSWFFGVIDFRQAMWIIIAIVCIGSASAIVNSLWGASGN